MIVKGRLGIPGELATEFVLVLQVVFVLSEKNKTDMLNRVEKALVGSGRGCTECGGCSVSPEGLRAEEDAQHKCR